MKLKNLLSALSLCLIASAPKAQPYLTMPDSGFVWSIAFGTSGIETDHFIPLGDTVIGSQLYVQAHRVSNDSDVTDGFLYHNYFCAYRSDTNGMVWIVPEYDSTEYLAFDFSKTTGDTFLISAFSGSGALYPNEQAVVLAVYDSVYNGILRKVMVVEVNWVTELWIEGIGRLAKYEDGAWFFLSGICKSNCIGMQFLCYKEYGTLVMQSEEMGTCYIVLTNTTGPAVPGHEWKTGPNPVSDFFQVTVPGGWETIPLTATLFDGSGHALRTFTWKDHKTHIIEKGILPSGIYSLVIRNASTQAQAAVFKVVITE